MSISKIYIISELKYLTLMPYSLNILRECDETTFGISLKKGRKAATTERSEERVDQHNNQFDSSEDESAVSHLTQIDQYIIKLKKRKGQLEIQLIENITSIAKENREYVLEVFFDEIKAIKKQMQQVKDDLRKFQRYSLLKRLGCA